MCEKQTVWIFYASRMLSYKTHSHKKHYSFIVDTSVTLLQFRVPVTPSINIQKGSLQMIKATVLAITGTRSFFTKLDSLPARPLLSASLPLRSGAVTKGKYQHVICLYCEINPPSRRDWSVKSNVACQTKKQRGVYYNRCSLKRQMLQTGTINLSPCPPSDSYPRRPNCYSRSITSIF